MAGPERLIAYIRASAQRGRVSLHTKDGFTDPRHPPRTHPSRRRPVVLYLPLRDGPATAMAPRPEGATLQGGRHGKTNPAPPPQGWRTSTTLVTSRIRVGDGRRGGAVASGGGSLGRNPRADQRNQNHRIRVQLSSGIAGRTAQNSGPTTFTNTEWWTQCGSLSPRESTSNCSESA